MLYYLRFGKVLALPGPAIADGWLALNFSSFPPNLPSASAGPKDAESTDLASFGTGAKAKGISSRSGFHRGQQKPNRLLFVAVVVAPQPNYAALLLPSRIFLPGAIWICFGLASARLGIVMLSTPLS